MTSDGFLGGHDDLVWPIKAAYFVLPFLISSRLNLVRVINPSVKGDSGEIKPGFVFDPLNFAVNLVFPAGI